MTKLFLSPYELNFGFPKPRNGFLLKVENDDFGAGFADIFPWPEFGDPEIGDIPKLLKAPFIESSLLRKSISFAMRDGVARTMGIRLLENRRLKNHFLVPECNPESFNLALQAHEQGFTHFKLKMARTPEQELQWLKSWSQSMPPEPNLRLDCNSRATVEFINELQPYQDWIEFIEDPFQDYNLWKTDWATFAFDQPPFPYDKVRTDWQVIKPAKQFEVDRVADRLIFTHYMDHPIGMAHAFYEAATSGPQLTPYGLMRQSCESTGDFQSLIQMDGCEMSFQDSGFGIGFTDLLKKCKWQSLW